MDRLPFAVVAFTNLLSVGTVYALSTIQAEVPRLFDVSHRWSLAPFAVACAGLSLGVLKSSSMMRNNGVLPTVTWGTTVWGASVMAAGYSLASLNFATLLISFFIGGVGVGLTYLGDAILLNQRFPENRLARSALGPIGFSTGVAACLTLDDLFLFSELDELRLGQLLSIGGVTFIAAAIIVSYMLSKITEKHSLPTHDTSSISSERFFSILLFFNALPGMSVFAALLPIASSYGHSSSWNWMQILAGSMAALAGGGILAPFISSRIGSRNTFTLLFCLRGMLLITVSQSRESSIPLLALCIVLFGHGAGFSILPGLLMARCSQIAHFSSCYGRILVAWGLAGIVGCALDAVLVSATGDDTALSLVLGLMTFSFGMTLYFVPQFGATALI